MSRPRISVPSQNVAEKGSQGAPTMADWLYGATHGPARARVIWVTVNAKPIRAEIGNRLSPKRTVNGAS